MINTTLIVVVMSLIGCSAYKGASDNSWTATFFKDPDRVWNAIELVLIELDYEVSAENRPDGVIRAESSPSEDGTIVALAIDQVMRTNDQVNVYVKPSFAGNAGSRDSNLLKAAADEFVAALEGKLKG
jgi:hypothetical protein